MVMLLARCGICKPNFDVRLRVLSWGSNELPRGEGSGLPNELRARLIGALKISLLFEYVPRSRLEIYIS